MGEGVRDHVTLALALQSIITNGSGGLHCRFHIAGLDEFPFLLRVMCPHARQTISLQRQLQHRPSANHCHYPHSAPPPRGFVQSGFYEVALTTAQWARFRHATSQNPQNSQAWANHDSSRRLGRGQQAWSVVFATLEGTDLTI
jgi:hypothetical protein